MVLCQHVPWFFYGQEGEDDPESHQQLVASGYPKE